MTVDRIYSRPDPDWTPAELRQWARGFATRLLGLVSEHAAADPDDALDNAIPH